MSMYATLEEAIEMAREEYLADNPELDEGEASVNQFNLQKFVMQDGDIMWQAEFLTDDSDEGELLAFRSGDAAQAIFEDDFDEVELRQEWLPEKTLYEWDEGEFQLEPPAGSEEADAAAEEWEDDNTDADNNYS